MYTVKYVTETTGISIRTLHYYDQIGLLKPSLHGENGYRLYDEQAMERLQQILFYKEFGVPLKVIALILGETSGRKISLLKEQRRLLCEKQAQIARQINKMDEILSAEIS